MSIQFSEQFSEVIDSAEGIRNILGQPAQRVIDKVIPALDIHCRAFIAASPFLLIASGNPQGGLDVSPKGDPPGFVQILDDKTLAIPDRVGNRRADTLLNIVESPAVGLLFLAPGKQETLRINGKAKIVRDLWLRERMTMQGKVPDLAIVVSVEEAFIHCAKCMIRSGLWKQDSWPNVDGLPSIAKMIADQTRSTEGIEAIEAAVAESYRDRLY